MSNSALYVLTVLIWGSTWFGISYQLGEVSPLVSIAHRFMLSTVIIFGYLWLRRPADLRLAWSDHGFVALQGMFLFCLNYIFIYHAAGILTSGLVAVVFSTMVFFNIVNGAIFLGKPVSKDVLAGGSIGLLGMLGLFWPELQALSLSDEIIQGLLMCLAGTLLASLGNIVASRNSARRLPVLTCNAWGMLYGAVTLYLAALLLGQPIAFDWRPSYLLSLAYLSIFGSVLAFWAYLSLVANIGVDRAAYTGLLFPVVALLISTAFEGYQWSAVAAAGLVLVLLGNGLVMRRARS
jgi:drug/metabolite transporter (DMT)-like permease